MIPDEDNHHGISLHVLVLGHFTLAVLFYIIVVTSITMATYSYITKVTYIHVAGDVEV